MTDKTTLSIDLSPVKLGLALVFLTLFLNFGLGAMFGMNEDLFQNFIHSGIAAHANLFSNPDKEQDIIWRWLQRAHFHAGGIGAFSLGMVILTALTNLSPRRKLITSTLIGLSIFYPLAWFTMFLYAPSIGRAAAHHAPLVELFTDIGVGSLSLGILSLVLGIFVPTKADRP
ncbi:MAG: hypothetical protein P4L87_04070 [Formivibrio sp.]|nr:hypothetical protein [Formivibrio sp.]